MATQQPIVRFRAGRISCAVFENEVEANGAMQPMLKATVARRYKDKDGNWKSSTSFSPNDIPVVVYCLTRAFDAMMDKERVKAESDGDPDEQLLF